MERRTRNQSGFTLIEVMLSMAMLMVIVVPMLSYFSDGAKYNHRSKIHQRAITVGEEVMEEVKSFDTIQDLTDYYAGAVADTGIASTDKYYKLGSSEIRNGAGYIFDTKEKYTYWKKGIESDKGKFDVEITVDAPVHSGSVPAGSNSNYATINEKGTVAITSLTQKNTAVAKDDDIVKGNAINYFKNLAGGSVNDADVFNAMSKKYYIDMMGSRIEKQGTVDEKKYTMVKITVEYTCSLSGCAGQQYQATMYNGLEVAEEELTGIYLFYNYENNPQIEVNFQSYPTGTHVEAKNAKIYAICQNPDPSDTQLIPVTINGLTSTADRVFSNIRYRDGLSGGENPKKAIEDMVGALKPIQRIADITVKVYPIENGTVSTVPKVTLTSTRGE